MLNGNGTEPTAPPSVYNDGAVTIVGMIGVVREAKPTGALR